MCRVRVGFVAEVRDFVFHPPLRRQATLLASALFATLLGASPEIARAATETEFTTTLTADKILVLKSQRALELLHDGVVIKTYPIALGPQPKGAKRLSGDGRTPEGLYTIDGRNERSLYHLSLHISYPSTAEQERATAAHMDPGGDIFIHGLPEHFASLDPKHFYKDWTLGCIAVSNRAIEEIWAAVRDGTPIEIRP